MSQLSEMKTNFYRLEPGDATKYVFSLTDTDQPHDFSHPSKIFSGIYGGGFVLLSFHMESSQGSYPVSKDVLKSQWDRSHLWGYLQGKMPGVDPYTLRVVIAAASVLIDRPLNLDEACERMML